MAVLGLIALLGMAEHRSTIRDRRLMMIMIVTIGSLVGLGLLIMIRKSIGWAALQTRYTIEGSVIAYLAIGLPVLVLALIMIVGALVRRDYGALFLLALIALVTTTITAIAHTLTSEPGTSWLWPAACLVLTVAVATWSRRRLERLQQPVR
jgi:hypothetical protein